MRVAGDRLERALLLDADDEAGRRPLLLEAERYARAAAELAPDEPDGWFLIAASVGMRSELESTRQQIRMAGEVWQAAATALERDSTHAGAHHVMGRLNFEAMRLSGVARMIATHLFGADMLRVATWQQAEYHLRQAAALDPDALVHRLWLARLYAERGDRESARRLFRTIVSSAAVSELDRVWQSEAEAELGEL